jgi:hypothetical protein
VGLEKDSLGNRSPVLDEGGLNARAESAE